MMKITTRLALIFLGTSLVPILLLATFWYCWDKAHQRADLSEHRAGVVLALQREIDGHKGVEASPRAARDTPQDYVNHLSTLSAKLTVSGRVLRANRAALVALGRTAAEARRTDLLAGPWFRQEPGGATPRPLSSGLRSLPPSTPRRVRTGCGG